MSVSIRISDDTAEELKSVQPDGMSLSKMCDTLLKLTLRKIKTDEEMMIQQNPLWNGKENF